MKIAGIVVSSSQISMVLMEYEGDEFELISQAPINLPTGDKAQAYRAVGEHLADQLREQQIHCVCIKSSAVSLGGTKLAHLEAAELRGIAISIAASLCEVKLVSKAATSRKFGDRSFDDYIGDNSYWEHLGLAALKKGAREAAFVAISQYL